MAYLVMEYLPGITLRELLKDYKKLTPEQTVDIMDAVLSGLAAAHKAGIVHRDLKPENVLLADDGRIKLGDFGLARAASANTATGQALLGTIAYLSPELVTRGVADARSDIYAVGIMMYEMLTGEQPYVGEAPMQIAYQHANDTVPTPSSKNPSVPAELDELVLWATARDPEERPNDARVMLERLREVEPGIRASRTPLRTQATMVIADAAMPIGAATAETTVLGGRRCRRTGRSPRRARAVRRRRGCDRPHRDGRTSPAPRVLDLRPRAPAHRPRRGHRLVLRRRPRRARDRTRDGDAAPRQRPAGARGGGVRGRRRRTQRPAGARRPGVRHRPGGRPAGDAGLGGHDVRVARAAHAARPRRRRPARGRRPCGPRRLHRRGTGHTAVLRRRRRRLGDRRARRRRQSPRGGVPRARRGHPGRVRRRGSRCHGPARRRGRGGDHRRRPGGRAGPSPSSATRCPSTT